MPTFLSNALQVMKDDEPDGGDDEQCGGEVDDEVCLDNTSPYILVL